MDEATAKEIEERLVSLETKLSYIEDFIDQLQEVSVAQTKQIDVLREQNQALSGGLQDLRESVDEIPDKKPPHY